MERYYYDHQHRLKRNGRNEKGSFHYFFPFLVFIAIGIVLALGFKLLTFFYGESNANFTVMYVDKGGAELKVWGDDKFGKAYSGTRILQGDEIMTYSDSRLVVRFFDGSYARVGGNTQIVFDEMTKEGDPTVRLIVKQGEIWVNKTPVSSSGTSFHVMGNYVEADPSGAIFDFEVKGDSEYVRVPVGSVPVDVYSQNKGVKVDHIEVTELKMAVFDDGKMDKFWKFQSPNVIEDLSADFKGGEWFKWNTLEDETPTDYEAKLTGNVTSVTTAGTPADGSTVTTYPDTTTVVPVVEPVVDPVVDPVTAPVVEPEPVLDLGALSLPTISEIGGVAFDSSKSETGVTIIEAPITVKGTVQGAAKVVVNGYTLQQFTPKIGQEIFTYRISENNKNLQKGENVYEVYAIGSNGEKGKSVFFKIIYEPKPEEIFTDDGGVVTGE